MILLYNNYTTKYWIKDEIKDCSCDYNNFIIDNNDNNFIINYEKLKNNDHNITGSEVNNEHRNTKFTSKYRTNKNTKNNIRSEFDRNKNKNNRNTNPKETNTYINLQRNNNSNNNKKKMSKMSPCSRISECSRRNILLAPCPKPIIYSV